MAYTRRTSPTDAVQFTDVVTLPKGVVAVTRQQQSRFPRGISQPAVTEYHLGDNGPLVHPTDWIVTYADGYQQVVADHEFHDKFQAV